jgi:hypothetical protein
MIGDESTAHSGRPTDVALTTGCVAFVAGRSVAGAEVFVVVNGATGAQAGFGFDAGKLVMDRLFGTLDDALVASRSAARLGRIFRRITNQALMSLFF